MKISSKKIFFAAGHNTVSMGRGRKEFRPASSRPVEDYVIEAGRAVIEKITSAEVIDEGVIGNFMASRFNRQAHLSALLPAIDKCLKYKPAIRVEGACASGGLALTAGVKSVLAGTADVVLAIGVEVQNSVKAVYGADYLALAGWNKKRKKGHAYFFPGEFSDRAREYKAAYGEEYTRKAFAQWYANCIENARLCPTAQEYHNTDPDLLKTASIPPNGNVFVSDLNVFDCSKVSDGASAILICSEEGLKKAGISKGEAVEIMSFVHIEDDLTAEPENPIELTTTKVAVEKVLRDAGISIDEIATIETHDCFTIAGVMAVEAIGLAEAGKGAQFVIDGNTSRHGKIPINTTGGLIGWGHPTGATGVHQAVTVWEQLTGKAGEAQVKIPNEKPYGLSINMGGNDKTVVSFVYKKP